LATFLVDMVFFNLLFALGAGPVAAHLGSVAIAVIFSYALMVLWVFRGRFKRSLLTRVTSFLAINLTALLASTLVVAIAEEIFEISGSAVASNGTKVAAVGLVAILKFLAYRGISFRPA
jgi:putative flippase GtrA